MIQSDINTDYAILIIKMKNTEADEETKKKKEKEKVNNEEKKKDEKKEKKKKNDKEERKEKKKEKTKEEKKDSPKHSKKEKKEKDNKHIKKDKQLNREDKSKKKEEIFNNISIINNQEENKNNLFENSIDDEIKELTKELKGISKDSTKSNEKLLEEENDINANEDQESKNKEKNENSLEGVLLKDYPRYKNQAQVSEIEKYLEKIKEYEVKGDFASKSKFKEIEHDDVINFKDEEVLQFFKSLNFILSENSKKRLNLLYFCIKHGFHILIPGPTGTGKTYLSEAICNLLKKNMIKYNCSENTKFPNLKFTCQGDKNKFAGIKYIEGPLLKALTTKNTAFLLDEANLAPIEVLQALEAMIDCGYLVYEDKGKLIRIDVPKDFCCILTLNPSKGKFSGTRQELPESFKNKFISIEFPEMKKEELYAITEGASKAFGVDKKVDDCKQFIDDFISFHWEWSQNEKIQDDVACLVIRDILAVLNIIVEGEDPTETIMNIYGARYIEPIKMEMKELLLKKDSFKNYKENYDKIKEEFPKSCFINKNTLELISTCVFSLKHGRYPIIAGNNGSGKKLLACKLADYFNECIAEKNIESESNIMNLTKNNIEKSKSEDQMVYIVYCTKSSKVEDLMGKPRVSNNKNEDLIQWQDGPLIKAVKEGKPLILIGIHELQSSVLEYMNDLLDRKYDGKQRYLNNPNNSNEPSIPVHKNFRLICTTLLSELNKLSPAFATRMDIKILNDQLEKITEEELFSLIKTCMNNVKYELLTYEEDMQKRLQELKEELKMNQTKQTDTSRKDSVNMKNSEHSNKSVDSKKSHESRHSNKSVDSKKSDKSKHSNKSVDSKKSDDSNYSKKSDDSKRSNKSKNSGDLNDSKKRNKSSISVDSRKSNGSKDSKQSDSSKKSNNSKDSKRSSDSKNSKRSNDSKNSKKSNDSKNSKKSNNSNEQIQTDSDDEFSRIKKRRRNSFNSDEYSENNNDVKEELDDDENSEEQYDDIIKEELEFLEERENEKFNEERIDSIINDKIVLSEIKKLFEEYNKENEIKMNMTHFEKFIRSTILIIYKLNISNEVDNKIMVKLVYDLLFSEQSSVIVDEKIKNYILSEKLNSDPLNKYFFIGIPKIENYMISLYLYCAMNIPIYVFGPPGVGKTAGAECLARIRTKNEKLVGNYKKYAFNSSTNPSDIFGAETIVEGQVKLIDGPLAESALKGQTFIADEMNLSSNNTMMSLIPIFISIRNRPIYLPGLQTPIKINPNFWFGAFQNYEGTAGRNATPHELSLKLVRLDYPNVEIEDIKNICIRIRDSIYKNQHPNISEDNILQLANFMIKLNKRREDGNLASAEAWSIRNLENIINRMAEQQKCEDIIYKSIQYENCSLYVNVLFYVLSYIDFESIEDSFDEILNLIIECFQLGKNGEELRKIYESKPEISFDSSSNLFCLRKYNATIKFRNSKIGNNINFLNKISSLLNTLFDCLLCADTEPILLIGPTGYKTYLVQLLIDEVKIITLNEESSIDALLGSTGFFNLEEVKAFYLSLICDVCIKNKKLDFLEKLKNGTLDTKELKDRINNFFSENNFICGKRIVFKDMIRRLFDKLLKVMDISDSNDDNILNNIKLEFKPGLFTTAILSGESLNLRNFDKIPTTTLERFNELFTGMKTLTLNEDKFNTITKPNDKLLCETVDFIRFFATSLTKNFSEAVLSRWTVINTKEYDFEELEEVLKICSGEKNLDTVTQNDIKYLIEVARFFKNTSNKTVSIKLLINAIELFHDMNINLCKFENLTNEDKEKYYYINRQFIYYITLKSIIEQNNEDEKITEDEIKNKLFKYLFPENIEKLIKKKSLFSFENKNNLNGMKSSITNAFIPCVRSKYSKADPAFTSKFVELLNIIHLGLSLNSSIVLEGQIGQGKTTAIKYLSEILGYKLLVIQLSSSNKEEDLLGKVIVDKDKITNTTIIKVNETDLLKILKSKSDVKDKYLIVFNDLQNASDAVKEKISNICDRHQKNVLLPDGNTIIKPALNIICVINADNNSDIRNRLPSPLLYSTIYHKIGNMPEEDIDEVTKSIFNKYFESNADEEAKDFIDKFKKVNSIFKSMKSRYLLTFDDINNYAKLRAATIKSFDKKLVDNMIFYYRTQEEEIINKLKAELNINGFDFVPTFDYNPCFTELSVQSNIENGQPFIINVINKDKININEIKMKLNSLTSQQRRCLLFLACSWKTKSKVIIRGDTASGKTHCAILFSEMLGADLLTYQMNQDITPSIFTGQSILEEDLNEEEIKLIKIYLSNLKNAFPKNNDIFAVIPNDPKRWNPTLFNKLFEILNIMIKNHKLENRRLLIESKTKINSIICPQGRFKETESQTSSGLIKGSWFLYDDIQFSTPDLLSIMTPLCSDEPSLNLFNAKDSPKYSIEIENNSMNNVKLINKNFNLIMTFNPKYCKNNLGLDPILENKCLTFNLLPNDYNYESCAQIYFGGLINSNINGDIANQLGGKLANVHMFAKNKSLENKELFEGDSIFSSRTINRAVKYINNKINETSKNGKNIDLPKLITVIIDKLYARPYNEIGFINNGEKSYQLIYREEILNIFKNDIIDYEKNHIIDNFDDNKKLLEQIINIQIAMTESKIIDFDFKEFVKNSLDIKLGSIHFILGHINSTLMLIYSGRKGLSSEYLSNCYQISIVYKLLKNIIKYGSKIGQQYNDKKLSDEELMNIDVLKWPILRLKLLKKLIETADIKPQILKKEFTNRTTEDEEENDDILENKTCFEILNLISNLVEKPEMNLFINLIKYIYDNQDSIEEIKKYIEIFIPYYKFEYSKLYDINIWLPLILKCIIKKQSFKICFTNNIEFVFNFENRKQNFKKLYFYFTKSDLLLSKYSKYETEYKDHYLKIEDDSKVIRFFHIVNGVLDTERISSKEFKNIERKFKDKEDFKLIKDNIEINSRHSYFKISRLFENEQKKNSIGKFWMIIYNMSDKSVKCFSKLLTNYERTIFNLLLRFFNNDKIENLDKFIAFTSSIKFYTDNLAILELEADEKFVEKKIHYIKKQNKSEKVRQALEDFNTTVLIAEKKGFEKINYYTTEIKRDDIVKQYENLSQLVEEKLKEDKETKEKNELKKKLEKLNSEIKGIKVKSQNKNLGTYQISLMQQIKKSISDEAFDKEVYEMYKSKYEQLKQLNSNIGKTSNNIDYDIKWPLIIKDVKYTKSKTTEFLEILIRYSKIKNIIDNIKKYNNDKDFKFKYILELQEFEEMKFASNLIISTEELIDDEFNLIYSTLNSYYIINVISKHLEKYLFNCTKEINNILENNFSLNDRNIINKNDYYYIHEYIKEINNKFLIQIPQLNQRDIVLLFIQFGAKNKKSKDYEPKEGPILKQIKYNRILDALLSKKSDILNDDMGERTAEKTAAIIIYTLSRDRFHISDNYQEFSKNIDQKISQLSENNNKNEEIKDKQEEKQFINVFKMTLDIARKIDELNKKEKIKLSFDDLYIFKDDKWYQNLDYTTQYPHLIYILNKYEGIYEDIKEFCEMPKEDEYYSIPYWLILLRLLANRENIEVDYNLENNALSKRITEEETNCLKQNLIEAKNNYTKKIDAVWLNLSIKNLYNSSLYSKKIRNIFEYIFYQIQKIPVLKEKISNIIEENIINFNNEIFKLYFSQQLETIFNMPLNEEKALVKMINNPKELYQNQIKEKYDNIMDDLIKNQTFLKLFDFYKGERNSEDNQNNEGKPFKTFINSLENEIENTLKQIEEEYKKKLELDMTKSIDKKANDIKLLMEDINYYCKETENLISQKNNENESKIIFDTFNKNIKLYKKNIENKNKDKHYINSKEIVSIKYSHVKIQKNKKDICKNILENVDIHQKDINIILNSIILSQYKLNLDLSKSDNLDFFVPFEERTANLIILKDEDKEIELKPEDEYKYSAQIYFKDNNKNYTRKIIVEIRSEILYKYEDIVIDKEKIKNDIKEAASKIDNRKTIDFGQGKYIQDSRLSSLLDKFNNDNINFSENINKIKEKKEIDCSKIIDNINNLHEKQEEISRYLKCHCSDGTQFPKITEKLNDIQN